MTLEKYLLKIEDFLKEYLEKTHCNGYVLGVSGGVDSSLVAALAKSAVGKDKIYCMIIPIESLQSDINDAVELMNTLDLNYRIVDGTAIYHQLKESFEKSNIEISDFSLGNAKARIRMTLLYAFGQANNFLVLGTDNWDERYTGYFTKYGDGGVDLLPIAHLTKGEVVEAALIKGLPEHLARKTPSAGLFPGQTDEKEMGILYKDLDDYLLGKKIDKKSEERIEHLHKISEHKRVPIPMPEPFERDEK